jgi:hypothetical protein
MKEYKMRKNKNSQSVAGAVGTVSVAADGNSQTVTTERPTTIDNGDDERGTVNSRQNQTTTQPEPSAAMTALAGETAGNVISPAIFGRGKAPNILRDRAAVLSQGLADKAQLQSEAAQRLAEAADLYAAGDASSSEAQVASGRAGLLLYQLRTAGNISAAETTELLGNAFGWRVKNGSERYDPQATGGKERGKTPFGMGEALRKRIVRSVQAHEHLNGGDGGRFFEGIEPDTEAGEGQFEGMTLKDVLDGMTKGDIGFWAAYQAMGEIKKNVTVRIEAHLDPKRVAAFAEKLREEGFATALANNEALQDAYIALSAMIAKASEEAGTLAKAA